jgi:hypothetical protein
MRAARVGGSLENRRQESGSNRHSGARTFREKLPHGERNLLDVCFQGEDRRVLVISLEGLCTCWNEIRIGHSHIASSGGCDFRKYSWKAG